MRRRNWIPKKLPIVQTLGSLHSAYSRNWEEYHAIMEDSDLYRFYVRVATVSHCTEQSSDRGREHIRAEVYTERGCEQTLQREGL